MHEVVRPNIDGVRRSIFYSTESLGVKNGEHLSVFDAIASEVVANLMSR